MTEPTTKAGRELLAAVWDDVHNWADFGSSRLSDDIVAIEREAAALAGSGPEAGLRPDALRKAVTGVVERMERDEISGRNAMLILRAALAATRAAPEGWYERGIRESNEADAAKDAATPTASPTDCRHPADALTDHADNPSRFRCRSCGSVLVDYGDGLGYVDRSAASPTATGEPKP